MSMIFRRRRRSRVRRRRGWICKGKSKEKQYKGVKAPVIKDLSFSIEKEEILEYINTTDNILKQNNSILKKDKTISNRKQRRTLIEQAFVALDRIRDQIDTKIDKELLIDELAYLTSIDYVNDDIDNIMITIIV